jgi:CheY-like chemotaxis protein
MERETPDVVLLNWSMPDLDGQAVLEHIELHPERRWPPVVVVSGWSGGGSGIERWRCEIAGQLRKPFTYEQVRTAVDAALHGRSI